MTTDMHPVLLTCPVCGDGLHATKLHCPACETTLQGQFSLGGFHGLSPEQLAFAEVFIRCEGKIKLVEQALNLSYPTVRGRLQNLIEAMGSD